MKLAANFAALAVMSLGMAPLSAQEAAAPRPKPAATGSTGSTGAKAKPLSIDEVQKIQAAKLAAARLAAARAASGATGSTSSTRPATTKAATGSSGTTGTPKAVAVKPAIAATGTQTSRPAVPPNAAPLVHPTARPAVPANAAPLVSHSAPVKAAPVAKASASSQPSAPAGPTPGVMNRTTIVLDPAHGGSDSGSRLADNLVEKDVTLAFAFKLRSLLQARGFTVVLTRDADPATTDSNPNPMTLDDRAGIANHSRAVACLLLHATAAGEGVHLYHSDLDPVPGETAALPWLTAQAAWVAQSTALAAKLSQSFTRASIPLVSSSASIRPVDSLTCPALVVELAPKGGDAGTLSDSSYQQSVAEALAGALVFWKNQAAAPMKTGGDAQ